VADFDRLNRPFGNEQGEITPIEWVDLVVDRAIGLKASDIHFDISFGTFVTRVRVDGILYKIDERPGDKAEMIIARLKIMGLLNSSEHRLPQEGHAVIDIKDEKVDIRISIFPTIFGEVAAVRILNRREFLFNTFEEMGMDPRDAELMGDIVRRPHGMILVTGPTGSGKSATLYTALNQVRSVEKNIVTLEDPVEYQLELVRQSQINPEINYDFARGMRSILRQDPDVIMIGEIRDNETAEIAVRAALTGRLLFSTLHTNDTIGAVIRFIEFGIPRSFVATALLLIIAKRLVRQNCPQCRQPYQPAEKFLKEAGIPLQEATGFFRGSGCENCRGTGFAGRVGVYELFHVDKDIQTLIIEQAPFMKVWETARTKGLRTLREEALRLAQNGQTTLEEAIHVTA